MTSPEARRDTVVYERITLSLLAAASAVGGVAVLIAPVRRALATLAGGEVPLTLSVSAEVPHTNGSSDVGIVSAGFDTASVVATGLDDVTRGLLATGYALEGLTIAACTGAAVWFILLIVWGRVFHRLALIAFIASGSSLLLGGTAASLLVAAGRTRAAAALNPSTGDVFDTSFLFDPVPTYVGIGLLVLIYVLQRGSRLQRDTEGLV